MPGLICIFLMTDEIEQICLEICHLNSKTDLNVCFFFLFSSEEDKSIIWLIHYTKV
jgi:hypothetical protein